MKLAKKKNSSYQYYLYLSNIWGYRRLDPSQPSVSPVL